jgi:hypothetical protein
VRATAFPNAAPGTGTSKIEPNVNLNTNREVRRAKCERQIASSTQAASDSKPFLIVLETIAV